MTSVWGELPGLDARIVAKAVDQRADEIIPTDAELGVAQRQALALVAICQDSLYTTGDDNPSSPSPVEVAVIVDARTATATGGESGVSVLAGPRLGPRTLEEIFCSGTIEMLGITETGEPLNLGCKTRTLSRKLRRFVLARDGGCTVESCPSPFRLEVHHSPPWSRGRRTDADQLITLCWFHHHISIHREGMEIHRMGPSRIRLKRPR